MKEKWIKTKLIDRSFEVFNVDGIKNGEVTRFVPLKLEINRHIKRIDTVVMNLNGMNMFLEYNWLVKHNPEVNWEKETMQFRYSRKYKMQHWDISFILRIWRLQPIEDTEKEQQKIGKELDLINPEDLPEYIQSFTYFFNKKKLKKNY